MEIPHSERYPGNLNLIKNVEDIVVFLDSNSVSFLVSLTIASYKHKIRKPLFAEKPQKKKKQLKETKTCVSNSNNWSDKGFKRTVINWA